MARLTDAAGKLLGGMEFELPLAALLAPLNTPAPLPNYASEEVVFALECNYGFSASPACSASPGLELSDKQPKSPPRCHAGIEEPDERHYCDQCFGFYCLIHAEPFNHDCAAPPA